MVQDRKDRQATQEQQVFEDPLVLKVLRALLDHVDQLVHVEHQVHQARLYQGHQELPDHLDLLGSLELPELRVTWVQEVI